MHHADAYASQAATSPEAFHRGRTHRTARRRAAWPSTRRQPRFTQLGGSHGPCAWVGRRLPRADGVHDDRCCGQFCGERARQSIQSSLVDSIRRCRAASDCEAEGRIGVGAGAATDLDDPRVCTLGPVIRPELLCGISDNARYFGPHSGSREPMTNSQDRALMVIPCRSASASLLSGILPKARRT
jgi:hypothetical protein